MVEKILVFGSDDEEQRKIETALLPLKLRLIFVKKEDYGEPLGALAGMTGLTNDNANQCVEDITDIFLVFAFFSDSKLNKTLTALRKVNLYYPYKAVLTKDNQSWPASICFSKIKQEHEKMNNKK